LPENNRSHFARSRGDERSTVPPSIELGLSTLAQFNRLDGVLPMGHEWIAGLPPNVRPLRLAIQYPRLVNLIAPEWDNPPVASTLLTDLLDYDRGHRDAFPVLVFAELRALRDHYFKAHLAERVIFREFEAIAAGLGK